MWMGLRPFPIRPQNFDRIGSFIKSFSVVFSKLPFCSKCGEEVAVEDHFCRNCGAPLPTVAEAPAPPTAPVPPSAPPAVPPAGLAYADLGQRIVAGLIDLIILAVIGFVVRLILIPFWGWWGWGWEWWGWWQGWPRGPHPPFPGWWPFIGLVGILFGVLSLLIPLIYFTYYEGTTGQTIGKRVSNIKVVKEDGVKCDMGSALLRTILRIIDWLPFIYILALVLIAASSKRQRLGDVVANTIVVKTA